MHEYQMLAQQLLRDFSAELYPETLTWTHSEKLIGDPNGLSVTTTKTCRCGVAALQDLPARTVEQLRVMPEFERAEAILRIHPDDVPTLEDWPPIGSWCNHPRFGRVELLAIGSESFWTMTRAGALTWTK
ncbi:hypothetical protein [Deinococcus fonticola]|uniref:hypothetical protein n=1 Tax=Deinococcus fonticola TaxID=2528713 RepID=UPI0010752429|nr:hypothetical protein [Deinococcus fonticola]